MATISELTSRQITPALKDRHKPHIDLLSGHILANGEGAEDRYEADVFNFLFDNREMLGIEKVMKFKALLVDGAIELKDGKRLTVEVKFRMNWEKACLAEYQFRTFLKRTDRMPFSVDGGLVVFEEFSGDWKRYTTSRLRENGWDNWYRSHSEIEGFRVDLLRLSNDGDKKLEHYPLSEDTVRKVEKT